MCPNRAILPNTRLSRFLYTFQDKREGILVFPVRLHVIQFAQKICSHFGHYCLKFRNTIFRRIKYHAWFCVFVMMIN